MQNSEELKIYSEIVEKYCTICKNENDLCYCGLIKTDDNSNLSNANQEIQKYSNSKFLCYNENCQKFFYVEDLIKHYGECNSQSNNQDNSDKKCQYCGQLVKLTKHLSVTSLKPGECDNFCTKCPNCDLPDVKIKEHFLVCPMKPKVCNLQKLGCPGLVAFNENKCTHNDKHEKFLKDSMKNISLQIKDLQSVDLDTKHETNEIDKISDEIKTLQKALIDIRNNLHTPRNGKLIWRIENAKEFLQEENPRFSSPIYSCDYGYKLCLKVYPKGDGIGKGKCFSIFFVIMKGDYDDLLSWPFKNKIKITFYNEDSPSKTKHEYYKPDNSAAFNKPNAKFNRASGNPEFIDQASLKDGFIIENSLFIELNIEQSKALF